MFQQQHNRRDRRFSDQTVAEIRSLALTLSSNAIAKMFGVNKSTISRIVRGDTWKTEGMQPA